MRILVATQKIAIGLSVSRCLSSAGHVVVEERETAAVVQRAETEDFDVVIIDGGLPGDAWLPLLQRLRSATGHFFLLVLGAGKHTAEATTAYTMGADDYVRVPFDRAEFVARMLPAERVRGLLRSSHEPRQRVVQQLIALNAWENLETRTASELSSMLNTECKPAAALNGWQAPHVVRLNYSLPQQQLEVVFHMIAEEGALTATTEVILGAPETSPEVLSEVAAEILNTLGGAFKREVPANTFELTTGLPEQTSLEEWAQAKSTSPGLKSWAITWGGHRVVVTASIHYRENTPILVGDLCEGMVLSTEIRNHSGVLLIAPGTRLTATAIHHIGRVVGTKFQVMVTGSAP